MNCKLCGEPLGLDGKCDCRAEDLRELEEEEETEEDEECDEQYSD